MIKTTRAQREALFKIFQRDFPGWITPTRRCISGYNPNLGTVKVPSLQYRRFLRKCEPELCGYSAIMVPWRGMWLGVERDGYTHS